MFLFAGAAGYAIHRYWVATSLTTLQRIYFKQYLKSSYRSYLPNSRSHYTTLSRVVTDPRTKKDISLAVLDDQIEAQLDENGRMKFDKKHYPIISRKPGVERKQFSWQETMTPDTTAYQWFRNTIYEGDSIPLIWRPAWLGGLLVFLPERVRSFTNCWNKWPSANQGKQSFVTTRQESLLRIILILPPTLCSTLLTLDHHIGRRRWRLTMRPLLRAPQIDISSPKAFSRTVTMAHPRRNSSSRPRGASSLECLN